MMPFTTITADSSGNLYLGGGFSSKLFMLYSNPESGGTSQTLENNRINCEADASGCEPDGFIAKYDKDGLLLWSFDFGSPNEDYVNDLVITPEDTIYVTGGFSNTVNFDPAQSALPLIAGGKDIFVAKYDPSGAHIWSFNIGSTANNLEEEGYAIDLDDLGNLYVTGYFTGENVDFNPVSNGPNIVLDAGTTQSEQSIFVAKYGPSSQLIWAYDIANAEANRINAGLDLEVIGSRLLIGGRFSGGAITNFSPVGNASGQNLIATSDSDGFVAEYSLDFDFQWAQSIPLDGEVTHVDGWT